MNAIKCKFGAFTWQFFHLMAHTSAGLVYFGSFNQSMSQSIISHQVANQAILHTIS